MAEDAWRGAVCRLVEDGFTVLHSLDDGTRLIDGLTGEVLDASPDPGSRTD
jgi:hypothetical protein